MVVVSDGEVDGLPVPMERNLIEILYKDEHIRYLSSWTHQVKLKIIHRSFIVCDSFNSSEMNIKLTYFQAGEMDQIHVRIKFTLDQI